MKKKLTHIVTLCITLLFFLNINAQDLRAIDNKGTIKRINKVTEGTTDPTAINPSEKRKGDTYIVKVGKTRKSYIFDGTQWVVLNDNHDFNLVHVGHFLIDNTMHGRTLEVTGVPFKPSIITFTSHANVGELTINSDNDYGPSNSNNNARSVHNSFGNMNGYTCKNGLTTQQQVIYIGGSGTSINDISRYSSNANCIGLRFSSQDGNNLGLIRASFSSFEGTGFKLNVTYTNGTVSIGNLGTLTSIQPTDILTRTALITYTAYR